MHLQPHTPPQRPGFRPGHQPPPRPTPRAELIAARRLRQLDYFRRLAEIGMRLAEIAGERAEQAHADGESPETVSAAVLDFARAARTVSLAVTVENRVISGEQAPRAPASDRRRFLLTTALGDSVKRNVPDKAARVALIRDIAERVEDTLVADPDAEIETTKHLLALADELHIRIEPKFLSDEILGMPPRPTEAEMRKRDAANRADELRLQEERRKQQAQAC